MKGKVHQDVAKNLKNMFCTEFRQKRNINIQKNVLRNTCCLKRVNNKRMCILEKLEMTFLEENRR